MSGERSVSLPCPKCGKALPAEVAAGAPPSVRCKPCGAVLSWSGNQLVEDAQWALPKARLGTARGESNGGASAAGAAAQPRKTMAMGVVAPPAAATASAGA